MDNKVHYHIIAGVEDPMQHGRGVALADFNRDGKTDIVYGNWNGPHRLYIQLNNRKQKFKVSSKVAPGYFTTLYAHKNITETKCILHAPNAHASLRLQKAGGIFIGQG